MIPFYEGYEGGNGGQNSMDVGRQTPQIRRSNDSEAFNRMYILQEEIGRGAFSVVHRCTSRITGDDFAVKVIDLRPLKLRENFDATRLTREVEIMRRLTHPNIIQLEEVFETPSTLMLVLEYARGTELFDSILQKKRYAEQEARPIFEQIGHALAYLHEKHIVHRDIKPENVVLLDRPSPDGYIPFAKLLDFGLSKMIGTAEGSAATTFVGTPCYLAPEVEARAYGQGNAYGTKVDCWSLGAVLYVMLVARFPEFDRSTGSMIVKMDSPAWTGVTAAAKDLIRSLMNPDPESRFTVQQVTSYLWVKTFLDKDQHRLPVLWAFITKQALHHPWVSGLPLQQQGAHTAPYSYAWEQQENPNRRGWVAPAPQAEVPATPYRAPSDASSHGPFLSDSSTSASMDMPSTPKKLEVFKFNPPSEPVRNGARKDGMLVIPSDARDMHAIIGEPVNLLPLVNIHQTITESIELAHRACEHRPEDAEEIKTVAILCRTQLIQSTKLLRQIEQTASSVLDLFPDLELAVDDGEPALAHDFFETVKKWVHDLHNMVADAQQRNQASMIQLHSVLNTDQRRLEAREGPRQAEDVTPGVEGNSDMDEGHGDSSFAVYGGAGEGGSSVGQEKSSLQATYPNEIGGQVGGINLMGAVGPGGEHLERAEQRLMSLDPELYKVVKKLKEARSDEVKMSEQQLLDLFFPVTMNGVIPTEPKIEPVIELPAAPGIPGEGGYRQEGEVVTMQGSGDNLEKTVAVKHHELSLVLGKLKDVDRILEQLAVFWAHTEVILDVLLQKSEHVERFVEFGHKPRLLSRFQQRMAEYKRFWHSVKTMCSHYVSAVSQGGPNTMGPRFYGLLENPR